jgi:hypothetical protein
MPKLDPAEPRIVLKQIASDTLCILKGLALEFAAQFDFASGSKRPALVGIRAFLPRAAGVHVVLFSSEMWRWLRRNRLLLGSAHDARRTLAPIQEATCPASRGAFSLLQ